MMTVSCKIQKKQVAVSIIMIFSVILISFYLHAYINPSIQEKIAFFLTILVSSTLVFYYVNPTDPHAVNVRALVCVQNGRFIADANRDSVLFWGVMFLTCVVGIVELLQLEPKQEFQKWLLFVLYVGLLIGMVLSMSKGWDLYRENYELTIKGKLGGDIKVYKLTNPSFIDKHKDILLCKWFEAIFIIVAIVFFELLFFVKI